MRNRLQRIGFPFLLAAQLAVTACGGGPGPSALALEGLPSGAGRGGKATLFFWQAPTTLNPYLSGSLKEMNAASIVIEGLAGHDENGNLVPALAIEIPTLENGGISEDYRSITWTLKPRLLWSDGTPLTSEDVVFTWQYCMAPGAGCALSTQFDGVSTVEAVDERTVKVSFANRKPYPYNPFVGYASPILQKAQFADCLGEAASQCTDANFMPIGTGPFRVVEFKTNDTAVLEINPHYRGIDQGFPFFGEIVIKGGGSAAAAARSVLQLGEADYAWNLQVDPLVLDAMEKRGRGRIVSAFANSVEYLFLNQTSPDPALGRLRSEFADGKNPHPFLSDPVVGRALSLAIDRQALVDIGYGDFAGKPACNIWLAFPEQTSTNNDECLTRNVGLARRLLDDAGIVDTDGDGVREKDGTPLQILYQTSTNKVRQTTQELIKEWWAEIGVSTELKNVNGSVFFGQDPSSPDTLGKFYADVEMYTNGPVSPDAEAYLALFTTAQIPTADNNFAPQNTSRFYSEEFDALYAELQMTADPARRDALIVSLNDLIVQSYSVVPLIDRGNVSAIASDIEGFRMNAWDSELWNIEMWTRRQ
jgi:peptide/nickel transport system substrate-binding protein